VSTSDDYYQALQAGLLCARELEALINGDNELLRIDRRLTARPDEAQTALNVLLRHTFRAAVLAATAIGLDDFHELMGNE